MASYAEFAVASFAIVIAPGASWMYVITSAIAHGRNGGLLAVAGNAIGILFHVAAAAFGLSALLRYSPKLFVAMKFLGAAYLIYLAIKTFRSRTEFASRQPETRGSIFRGGILVNATNPKVALLMLALLPHYVNLESANVTFQILTCGMIHVLIASTLLSLLATITSRTRNTIVESKKADRIFRWTSAVILIVLGVQLLLVSTPTAKAYDPGLNETKIDQPKSDDKKSSSSKEKSDAQ